MVKTWDILDAHIVKEQENVSITISAHIAGEPGKDGLKEQETHIKNIGEKNAEETRIL